jgi:uncharacterized protein YigA (DUF484 family)
MELARRAAIAVERAQLHRQAIDARANAERSARVADRLYSLTARLTGAATPEAVATAVLSEASDAFAADRGTLSLIEDDGDTTRSLAAFGYPPEVLSEWRTYSLRETVSASREAVATQRGVFIASLADARVRYPAIAPLLERVGTETAVALPVITDGRARAIITLSWTTVREIDEDTRDFMELYASQCGQALARALSFDAERVARERTERLQRLTAALAGASSESDVTHVVVSNLRDVALASRVAIYRVEPGVDGHAELAMVDESGVDASTRMRYGRVALDSPFPVAEIIRKREPVFLRDHAAFRERFRDWPADGRAADQEAWAALPLVS